MGTPHPIAAQRAVTPIVPRVTQTEAVGAAHQGGGIERAPAEADVWNYRPPSAVKLPATLNKERHTGDQPMAGRFQGYHAIRREETEGHLRFEVYWQDAGWFWRPLFQLDGGVVGPFTTSSQAYESAITADEVVRPRRAG